MVKAGLSPREFIEQSSCFVFQNGLVLTFNDEIACRVPIGGSLKGAVAANLLFTILSKIPDDDLRVTEHNGELEFRGKRKKFGVVRDSEIFLPVDRVETPKKWNPLSEDLAQSVKLVQHCVGKDESKFLLTCVHLHPDYIEACDNHQVMRCQSKTGFTKPILVRGSSLKHIISLQLDEVSITDNWLHFRNKQTELIFSTRKYEEEYPDLEKLLKVKGHPITLPRSIGEVCDRAEIFSTDQGVKDPLVEVSLSDGVIRLTGRGGAGWYKEAKKAAYNGPPLLFSIAPQLLKYISETGTDFLVSESRIKVSGVTDNMEWNYITALGKIQNE